MAAATTTSQIWVGSVTVLGMPTYGLKEKIGSSEESLRLGDII
jgi:hypothetical protein